MKDSWVEFHPVLRNLAQNQVLVHMGIFQWWKLEGSEILNSLKTIALVS